MEVRAWSGAGWWEVLLPGVGIVEVQPAGAVQGLLGLTDRQATGQHRVRVPVPAGEVDGKPPQARGAAVTQPAQWQDLAALEVAVDVGEAAAESDGDAGQAGPALPLASSEPLAKGGLGGLGDGRWHRAMMPDPSGRVRSRRLPARPAGRPVGWLVGGGMVARGGGRSRFAVVLTASQRRFLKRLVRRPTAQQRQVTRARIVSVIQRKVLSPNDFRDLLLDRLEQHQRAAAA